MAGREEAWHGRERSGNGVVITSKPVPRGVLPPARLPHLDSIAPLNSATNRGQRSKRMRPWEDISRSNPHSPLGFCTSTSGLLWTAPKTPLVPPSHTSQSISPTGGLFYFHQDYTIAEK